MEREIIEKLNDLNKQFYIDVADEFSASRDYYWKGWERLQSLIDSMLPGTRILDVGCGNGRFLSFIRETRSDIQYVGIDFSDDLLDVARQNHAEDENSSFMVVDLLESFKVEGKFDLIVMFGVMHHIPGRDTRVALLDNLASLMNSTATLVCSYWQFDKIPVLIKRAASAEKIGLSKEDLEDNDYILDWTRGKKAYRYCHLYKESEIAQLYLEVGLQIEDSFASDGKTKDRNLYIVATISNS